MTLPRLRLALSVLAALCAITATLPAEAATGGQLTIRAGRGDSCVVRMTSSAKVNAPSAADVAAVGPEPSALAVFDRRHVLVAGYIVVPHLDGPRVVWFSSGSRWLGAGTYLLIRMGASASPLLLSTSGRSQACRADAASGVPHTLAGRSHRSLAQWDTELRMPTTQAVTFRYFVAEGYAQGAVRGRVCFAHSGCHTDCASSLKDGDDYLVAPAATFSGVGVTAVQTHRPSQGAAITWSGCVAATGAGEMNEGVGWIATPAGQTAF